MAKFTPDPDRIIGGRVFTDIRDLPPRARRPRYYHPITKEELPSVTTVLGVYPKPALVGWARKDGLQRVIKYVTSQKRKRYTVAQVVEAVEASKKWRGVTDPKDYGGDTHTAILRLSLIHI